MLSQYRPDIDQIGSPLEITEDTATLLGQHIRFSRPSATRVLQLFEEPLLDEALENLPQRLPGQIRLVHDPRRFIVAILHCVEHTQDDLKLGPTKLQTSSPHDWRLTGFLGGIGI